MHLPVGLPTFEQRAEVRARSRRRSDPSPAPAPSPTRCSRPRTAPRSTGLPSPSATGTSTMRGIVPRCVVRIPQGANEFRLRGVDAHQHQAEHQVVPARRSSGTPWTAPRRPRRRPRPSGSACCRDARYTAPPRPAADDAPRRHRAERGRRPSGGSAHSFGRWYGVKRKQETMGIKDIGRLAGSRRRAQSPDRRHLRHPVADRSGLDGEDLGIDRPHRRVAAGGLRPWQVPEPRHHRRVRRSVPRQGAVDGARQPGTAHRAGGHGRRPAAPRDRRAAQADALHPGTQ